MHPLKVNCNYSAALANKQMVPWPANSTSTHTSMFLFSWVTRKQLKFSAANASGSDWVICGLGCLTWSLSSQIANVLMGHCKGLEIKLWKPQKSPEASCLNPRLTLESELIPLIIYHQCNAFEVCLKRHIAASGNWILTSEGFYWI